MRTSDDIDATSSTGLSRRSVIKAGAHAAWVIPAVQIVAAAPAFAVCSAPGGGGTAPVMTVPTVTLAWGTQGNSYYLKVTITACATNDNDGCNETLTGLKASIKTRNPDVDLQEHSTVDDNPGTKWQNSGHLPKGNGPATTQIYTSTYEIPEGTCVTTAPVQVRAAGGDGTFTGKIDVIVENSQGAKVTVTKDVPAHP